MTALRDSRGRLALVCAALGALVLAVLSVAFWKREAAHVTVEPPSAASAPTLVESSSLEAPVLEQPPEPTDASDRVVSASSTSDGDKTAGPLRVHVDARIVGPDDEPLSGARMNAPDLPRVAATSSDSDGRIDWTIEFAAESDAAKQGVARALVSCAGFASAPCTLMLLPDPDCHLGTLRLQPGASIAGFVRDREGRAVPDVEILPALEVPETEFPQRLDHLRARGASDGSFRVDGLPLGSMCLKVEAPRMNRLSVPHIELAHAGEVVAVQITLDELAPDAWIEGRVLDPGGQPYAGAILRVSFSGPRVAWISNEAKSNAAGVISFKPGEVRPDQLVKAADPAGRYDPSEAQPLVLGARGLEFRLREARHFRARLVNEHGEVVPWGWIDLMAAGIESRAPGYWESTDRSGLAHMRVPPETFRARVFAQGYRTRDFGPFDPKDIGEELEFALTAGQCVRGRVVARGFGVPGAEVLLCSALAPDRPAVSTNATIGGQTFDVLGSMNAGGQTTTDAQGRFVLTIHNSGWYCVRAHYQKRGFASVGPMKLQTDGDNDDVVLDLQEPGALRGRVVVAPGRSPDGIAVGVSNGDGVAYVRTVGADGTFRFDELIAGGWQVRHCRAGLAPTQGLSSNSEWLADLGYAGSGPVSASARKAARKRFDADVVIEPGRTAEYVLDLIEENQCVLAGRLEMAGLPPINARVGMFEEHARAGELDTALVDARLDAKGTFRIEVTTPGRYRLRIVAREMLVYDVVELRPGEVQWERSLSCGRLRAEGVPQSKELLAKRRELIHDWHGPGDLRVLHCFATANDGVVEFAQVPEGPGQIVWIKIEDGVGAQMHATPVMDTLVRAGEECRVTLPQMR